MDRAETALHKGALRHGKAMAGLYKWREDPKRPGLYLRRVPWLE